MRVLYHLSYAGGLGAERWIYEGYKAAFEDLGHEFRALTNYDEPRKVVREFAPEIFMTSTGAFSGQKNRDFLEILEKFGTRALFSVDHDFRSYLLTLQDLQKRKFKLWYYGFCSVEEMSGFEKETGKAYHLVPLAANRFTHFPSAPDPRYAYDIVFVGAKLEKKKFLFDKVLFPLAKKYRVGIFGPGWTLKDHLLRLASGIARKLKIVPLADAVNRARVSVTVEEERALYSSSKICVNFHEYHDGRVYDHSNEREFKIPASGGFQMSDYVPMMADLFEPDKEIVLCRTPGEWFEKTAYYLGRGEEREIIRRAGTARALNEHTYHHRIKQILDYALTM